MEKISKLDSKFIVDLKGKQYITYEGLLDLAHKEGLVSIETELIQIPSQENEYLAIVRAVACTKEKKFMGIGDCDNKSVNAMIWPHKIRMAETRAKARALRDLTNVGMTALEELGDEGENHELQTTEKQIKRLSDAQIKRLYAIAYSADMDAETVKLQVQRKFNKKVEDLTKEEYEQVCMGYEQLKK